jgi:hypothetical protein
LSLPGAAATIPLPREPLPDERVNTAKPPHQPVE